MVTLVVFLAGPDLSNPTDIFIFGGFTLIAALITASSLVTVAVINNNGIKQREEAAALREQQLQQYTEATAAAQKVAAKTEAVATQAADAAKLLLDRQNAVAGKAEEAANLLLDANERVANTTKQTNAKLEEIHTLVNSSLTSAMQAELDARINESVLMREIMDMKEAAGKPPTDTVKNVLAANESKVIELQATLSTRKKAQEIVDAEVKVAKDVP